MTVLTPLSAPMAAVRRRSVAGLACVAYAVLLSGAGCSSAAGPVADSAGATGESSAAASPDPGRVLLPGRPGEPVTTGGPEDVPTSGGSEQGWNDADTRFVQLMIPHHAQALEMSGLATTRADSDGVAALAGRISAAQAPEIRTLSSWLADQELAVPGAEGPGDHPDVQHGEQHGEQAMSGMLTEKQMADLAAARGERFDRLFLQGMIGHHQGAVEMARTVAVDGADLRVSELAADVQAGQSAEVDRMRDLLAGLG